jgi:LysM repeat protein
MKSSQFSTRLRRRQQFRQKTWNNLVIGVIVLIPIYPAFGSYMQDYTGAIVRGEYDQSTIIDAQDGTTGEDTFDILDIVDVETVDVLQPEIPAVVPEPVLPEPPPSLPIDKKRSLYLTHVVASGDTLSTLAQKYDVSLSALREVNNLSDNFLALKQKLIIPRIKGVSYTVQKGDTLSTIAEKYGITQAQNILLANDLQQGGVLSIGKVLLLPNPTKDPTKKVVNNPPTKKPVATTTNKTKTASPKKETPTEIKTLTYGGYSLDLKVEKWCRSFAWWNCTCFVAKYKNVTWRWNAKDWLKNARKQGVATGDTPKPGAIIVYHGPGFPPAYGHVGIVMEVGDEGMVIKDMNYRALNEVTTRRESYDNPAIIGYIYVD